MPSWKNILDEIQAKGSTLDIIRKDYLKKLHSYTKRNTIAYYSGWLHQQGSTIQQTTDLFQVNNQDMEGFMTTIHKLPADKGLDLILHTPGGDVAATESIINYLLEKFNDIRVIVPQLAMSAGTMIACSANQIVMGKHSNLGPIDPSLGVLSAHGVIEEFKTAHEEIKQDQSKILVWQPILQKYPPTLLGECEKAIKWAEQVVKHSLKYRMFKNTDTKEATKRIERIIKELGDHSTNLSHNRHIPIKKCEEIGLNIIKLESDSGLQEAVLSAHHCFIHTFANTPISKIIENHNGVSHVTWYRAI